MRTRTLTLVALLAAWTLVLTGCNKSEEPAEAEQALNEAAQYCIDNGGTHEIVTSETAVYGECTLPDGTVCEEWDYFEWKCPEAVVEEKSLTMDEINELIKTHFPKSYTFSEFDVASNLIWDEGDHVYTGDEIGTLTPTHANISKSQVLGSGIEDGMIKTETLAVLESGTIVNIVYVVDPDTMNFVAANISDWDLITNYQFQY